MNPWVLDYWKSGEYQAVREKLDAEVAKGFRINPERKNIFRSLALCPESKVKCVIIGQDPYPDHRFATGVAFSIPSSFTRLEWPPTLTTFLTEWGDDLGYTLPDNGNLEEWCSQGVLLWNAIPSCRAGTSLSHDWEGREWDYLTSEIVSRLSKKGLAFAFLGGVARRFTDATILDERSKAIVTSHPSPRGSRSSNNPFIGSRLFSQLNYNLHQLGLEPIDWRLHGASTREVPRTNMVGGRILENISGVNLPGLRQSKGPNRYVGNFEI